MNQWKVMGCAAFVSVWGVTAMAAGEDSRIPAVANLIAAKSVGGCMVETAQISISFNGMEQEVKAIQSKIDDRIKEAEKLAESLHAVTLQRQSMSYNVSSQNYGGAGIAQYQFSGSIGFTISPANKGIELVDLLSKKGFQTNLSVNSYRNGNAACPAAGE